MNDDFKNSPETTNEESNKPQSNDSATTNPEETGSTSAQATNTSQELNNFQKFTTQLSYEIDKALNEEGERKIGFALFLFDATGQNSTATVLSNVPDQVMKVVSVFVQKMKLQEEKKERRSNIIRVK